MKIHLFASFLLVTQFAHSSISYSTHTYAFEHLVTINAKWSLHEDVAPAKQLSFKTDVDRIRYHLLLVTKYLRNASPKLTKHQLSKRVALLDSLYRYAQAKQFPINTGHSKRTPYFIDKYGTHCAVGHLIKVSGYENLAINISLEHNYDYIADIKTAGLTEWAHEHGFDIDELKWIQPSYGVEFTTSAFGNEVNGEVRVLRRCDTENSSRLLIAGEFSKLDGKDCKRIGFYESGTFHCMGKGIDGTVNDLYYDNDTTWAFGDLSIGEEAYSIAYHHQGEWNGFKMPENALYMAEIFETSQVSNWVALHSPDSQRAQIWNIKNRKNPHLLFELNGWVSDIEATPYGTAIAGEFDTVFHVDSLKELRSQFLFFFQQNPELFRTIDSLDVIRLNKIAYLDSTVFLMGANNHLNFFRNQQQCLHIYEPDTIMAVKNSMEFFGSVLDMSVYQDRVYFAGDFNLSWGTGDSRSLGSLNGVMNSVGFGGYIGGTVNALEYLPDEDIMVIGGKFTGWDGFGKPIANLVMRDNNSSSIILNQPTTPALFPNPASDEVSVTLDGAVVFNLWDIQNRKVLQHNHLPQLETGSVALNELENGVYVAEILTDGGDRFIEKLIIHH